MRNAPATRPSLILRLRNRDDLDAWQQFVEIYQPLVYRLAMRHGFQPNDAADIVQEVLLRVAGAVERWVPDERQGSFRAWLHRIARNLMINFLDSRNRRPQLISPGHYDDLLVVDLDASDQVSAEMDEEIQRQLFNRAAARVQSACDEKTWAAFRLSAVEGIPIQDVAAALGVPVGVVYVSRSRVIRRIRTEVEKFNGHSGPTEKQS